MGDTIRVKVRLFAGPREALGIGEVAVEVSPGATVESLIEQLQGEHPVLKSYTRFLSVAVNRSYVSLQTELQDGDDVALLPPVGGG